MVPDFRKANWDRFVGKMNNLIQEYLFQGTSSYEMWDILKSLLNKFTKQFIPIKKKIGENKGLKPKWMNGKIKILIRETKITYQIQKQIHQKKNIRDIGNLCKTRKGKLGKIRDYVKQNQQTA